MLITLPPYNATCDGFTDDTPAFQSAFDGQSLTGGGSIYVPAGKTCILNSAVFLRDNIELIGLPGATIKAADSNTTGLIGAVNIISKSCTTGTKKYQTCTTDNTDGTTGCPSGTCPNCCVNQLYAHNTRIEGLNFNLNNLRLGVGMNGDGAVFRRNRVYGAPAASGAAYNLVSIGCPAANLSTCNIDHNRIACGNTAGAQDTGLYVSAGTAPSGQLAFVEHNEITSCDANGITLGTVPAIVSKNSVSTIGSSSVAISSATADVLNNTIGTTGTSAVAIDEQLVGGIVRDNRITASGNSAYGIKLTSASTAAIGNRLTMSGTNPIAIRTYVSNHQIQGNRYSLTGGSGAAVGLYIGDGGSLDNNISIVGNVGNVQTPDQQTHILLASSQVQITGNLFTKGKFGVAPSQASSTEFAQAYNYDIVGNRFYAQSYEAIIAKTGATVVGNYIAWLGEGALAAIEIGDSLRTYQAGTEHTEIDSNIIHSQEVGVAGIYVGDQPANAGATYYAGVQVVGNDFILGQENAGTGIDFSHALASGTSAPIYNWVITGNTFDANTGTSWAAINCPTSNQNLMWGIEVGTNSFRGKVVAAGETSYGRIALNCTPAMVNDSLSGPPVYLQAAGCNGTSPYPIFNLPASNAPTYVCNGSHFPGGFLSFPDSSTTSAFVRVPTDGAGTYQFFVQPRYVVAASNVLVTRWSFTAVCIASGAVLDATFGTDNTNNIDTTYPGTSGQLMVPTTFSTMGAIACGPNSELAIRISRIGEDAADTQTSSSLLDGFMVWFRRQN